MAPWHFCGMALWHSGTLALSYHDTMALSKKYGTLANPWHSQKSMAQVALERFLDFSLKVQKWKQKKRGKVQIILELQVRLLFSITLDNFHRTFTSTKNVTDIKRAVGLPRSSPTLWISCENYLMHCICWQGSWFLWCTCKSKLNLLCIFIAKANYYVYVLYLPIYKFPFSDFPMQENKGILHTFFIRIILFYLSLVILRKSGFWALNNLYTILKYN